MNPSVTIRGRSRPAHWRRLERERRVAENGDSFLVGETLVQPPVLEGRGFYFGAVADGLGERATTILPPKPPCGRWSGFFSASSRFSS